MTLIAFARLMRRVGAVEALNMDGGGSSQLVVSGQVVNRPSERPLRAVPSGWVVRPA
jgi:exopolysaccharide biosynthesis protein